MPRYDRCIVRYGSKYIIESVVQVHLCSRVVYYITDLSVDSVVLYHLYSGVVYDITDVSAKQCSTR